jgi:L-lactate dehydrogenase (cytochrome)
VPVAGSRLRDVHNGLVFPPRSTLRTLGDMAMHPSWWANVLTTEPLRFASLKAPPTTVARVASLFDAALNDADIGWLRELWDGPLVVKGVLTAEDARRVIDLGVLPEIVEAIGDRAEVFLDSGILTGADIVAAVATGARACLVARLLLRADGRRRARRPARPRPAARRARAHDGAATRCGRRKSSRHELSITPPCDTS